MSRKLSYLLLVFIVGPLFYAYSINHLIMKMKMPAWHGGYLRGAGYRFEGMTGRQAAGSVKGDRGRQMARKGAEADNEVMQAINEFSDFVADETGLNERAKSKADGVPTKQRAQRKGNPDKRSHLLRASQRLVWDALQYLFILFYTVFFATSVILCTRRCHESCKV